MEGRGTDKTQLSAFLFIPLYEEVQVQTVGCMYISIELRTYMNIMKHIKRNA